MKKLKDFLSKYPLLRIVGVLVFGVILLNLIVSLSTNNRSSVESALLELVEVDNAVQGESMDLSRIASSLPFRYQGLSIERRFDKIFIKYTGSEDEIAFYRQVAGLFLKNFGMTIQNPVIVEIFEVKNSALD